MGDASPVGWAPAPWVPYAGLPPWPGMVSACLKDRQRRADDDHVLRTLRRGHEATSRRPR